MRLPFEALVRGIKALGCEIPLWIRERGGVVVFVVMVVVMSGVGVEMRLRQVERRHAMELEYTLKLPRSNLNYIQ